MSWLYFTLLPKPFYCGPLFQKLRQTVAFFRSTHALLFRVKHALMLTFMSSPVTLWCVFIRIPVFQIFQTILNTAAFLNTLSQQYYILTIHAHTRVPQMIITPVCYNSVNIPHSSRRFLSTRFGDYNIHGACKFRFRGQKCTSVR